MKTKEIEFKEEVNYLFKNYALYINSKLPSIDSLKTVQRRILYVLSNYKNFTKSATVVGEVIGKYHPHGDSSVYSTLVNLVNRGLAIGKGNWGSYNITIEIIPPAAYRYTEVKGYFDDECISESYELLPYSLKVINEMSNTEPLLLPCRYPLNMLYRVPNRGDNTIGVTVVNNSFTFTKESLDSVTTQLIDKFKKEIEEVNEYQDIIDMIDICENTNLELSYLIAKLTEYDSGCKVDPLSYKSTCSFSIKYNISDFDNSTKLVETYYPLSKLKKLTEKYKDLIKIVDESKKTTKIKIFVKKSSFNDVFKEIENNLKVTGTLINTISIPKIEVLKENVPENYIVRNIKLASLVFANLLYYYLVRKNKINNEINKTISSIEEKKCIQVIKHFIRNNNIDSSLESFAQKLANVNSQFSYEEYLKVLSKYNIKSLVTVDSDIEKDKSKLKELENKRMSLINDIYNSYKTN